MTEGVIKVSPRDSASGQAWSPVQGEAFTRLIRSDAPLSEDERDQLTNETISILGNCIDPENPAGQNTGLVIGYVQSGKTLSFTSLAALASDNKFRLIILLAGTTNNLVEQSYNRIRHDLDIDNNRDWNIFTTQQDKFQSGEFDRVKMELSKWRRGSPRARTILIVTMKQHQHLEKLARLLSTLDLADTPSLIIDDEGDQAGINTKAKKDEQSTTYARIMELRDALPNHSYLLYTATPQAPLLISRIDVLSPDFGKVLTPGEQYIGGQEFFIEGADRCIELIPASEVPDRNDPPTEPPATLLAALRDFFIGVTIGLLEEEDRKGRNRSMMIHPAVPKDEHLMFARWARQTIDHWTVVLEDTSHHEHDSLMKLFKASTEKLLKTYQSEFGFDEIAPLLFEAVEGTAIVELNTRQNTRIPNVDWRSEYSWILIGGIGLDRGFTIEGLTVSYMPRSTGVGNADNIQQRARFFGYKRDYLGLCRVYLTSENIDAFTGYVSHEESVRNSIRKHLANGQSLKDWRRTYFLDQSLQPTRSSVILLEMYQSKGKGGWILPDHPHEDPEIVAENREIVDSILSDFDLEPYAEPGWNDKQTVPAFSDEISLARILTYAERIRYKWPDDTLQHSSIVLMLTKLIADDPSIVCSFYGFSGPWSGVSAKRSLNDKQPATIKNLFQGANARTNYPGARALISHEAVTFQLHRYDLETSDKRRIMNDVPVLAVHIPEPLIERIWIER